MDDGTGIPLREGPRPRRSAGPMPVSRRTAVEKIRSFWAAVSGPKVSEDTFRQRLAICASNVCGHLVKPPAGGLFCGACGCPRWKLAELGTKLQFAKLECPCDPPPWG